MSAVESAEPLKLPETPEEVAAIEEDE